MGQGSAGVQAIAFDVVGLPAPQGSKSFKGMRTSKATGKSHAVLVESSKRVKPWRKAVETAAREVMQAHLAEAGVALLTFGNAVAYNFPIDAPVRVRVVFTMPKPKSAPKTRRTFPDRMPDVSKLLRATEDAITDAGLWADDARVVDYTRVAKVFPGEDPEALPMPGARITIEVVQ
jgi:hypothetical protein